MRYELPEKIDACFDEVSINADLAIACGYDEGVGEKGNPNSTDTLSPAVAVQLADVMIARWQQYREQAIKGCVSSADKD